MSQTLQIIKNNKDISGKGIRESSKLLQQYLPDITASLLGSVIILGQGLPQKFTNNTPSGRKEVLEKLSKSDFMIEDLKQRVADRKSSLQSEFRSYEDKILSATSKKNFLIKQIEENTQLLKTLNKDNIEQTVFNYKFEVDQLAQQLEELNLRYDDTYSNYSNITSLLEEATLSKNSELEALTAQYKQDIAPYSQSSEDLNVEYKALNKQIAQMKAIKDVCPTCGQKLPDVHKPDTTELEVEISNISSKLYEINEQLVSFERTFNIQSLDIKSRYEGKISELTNQRLTLNNVLMSLKSEQQQLQQKQTNLLNMISSEEIKLAQLQAAIDNCNNIIRNNNENILITEEEILYNNKQRDLTQSHVEVVNKFDTALKRDFRGYLLSTVISFIEQRAKHYSDIIFGATNITFTLDGNNIDISYMNRAYENLSGGEKQKVDLIIQFSIRDMLSLQLGFTSNILVLDEVFDGLDALGCAKVIDMIASVSDIKNIFIVTHRKDLSIPTDVELTVVKSSVGISEII